MEEFEEILEEKYGIQVYTDHIDLVFDSEEMKKLMKAIRMSNPEKPEATVKHDAANIKLIEILRSRSREVEIIGPRYWFLTRDRTLNFAEITILGKSLPSSIHIKTWFDLISPFISVDISKPLAELLATPLIVEEEVDPEQILFAIKALGPLLEDPNISTETLKKIIGSAYIKKHLEMLKKYYAEGIRDKMLKMLLEHEAEKLRTEIMKKLKKEIEKERIKVKRRNIVITILSTLLLLLISYVAYINVSMIVGWIIAVSSIIGGAVSIIFQLLGGINALLNILHWLHRLLRKREENKHS